MKDIGQKIQALLAWVESPQNSSFFVSDKLAVKNNAVSGRGLYAEEGISAGEKLINIPRPFLLNHTTALAHVSEHFSKSAPSDFVAEFYSRLLPLLLERLSSFQLVSMFLALESLRKHSFWAPFIAMLPDLAELSAAPVVARVLSPQSSLWAFLPRSTRKHSEQVLARFDKDWELVSHIFTEYDLQKVQDLERRFLWAWMCVNSRCLYMEIPGKEGADNFTMAPYVDFLNHTSHEECGIQIDSGGFHVYTSTPYSKGDELHFSYGPHLNEFLLCEYGFVLGENKWNYIDITDIISPLLRPAHVQFLKSNAYYGEYTVSKDGMSFRTEIALATMQETAPDTSTRLRAFLDGTSEGGAYVQASSKLLDRILRKILSDCVTKLSREVPKDAAFEGVRQLYRDMKDICEVVLGE